jgi:hypothetical protein
MRLHPLVYVFGIVVSLECAVIAQVVAVLR